jgi:hypothetical protein
MDTDLSESGFYQPRQSESGDDDSHSTGDDGSHLGGSDDGSSHVGGAALRGSLTPAGSIAAAAKTWGYKASNGSHAKVESVLHTAGRARDILYETDPVNRLGSEYFSTETLATDTSKLLSWCSVNEDASWNVAGVDGDIALQIETDTCEWNKMMEESKEFVPFAGNLKRYILHLGDAAEAIDSMGLKSIEESVAAAWQKVRGHISSAIRAAQLLQMTVGFELALKPGRSSESPDSINSRSTVSGKDSIASLSFDSSGRAGAMPAQTLTSPSLAAYADHVFCAKHPAPPISGGHLYTGEHATLPSPPDPPVCDVETNTHGPWLVVETDESYYRITKYSPTLPSPKNARCGTCGITANYMAVLKSWALDNLSAEARAEYDDGNHAFEGVDLDPTGLAFVGESPTSSQRETVAALIVLGIQYLEHDYGHRPKCFGSSKKKRKKHCRYILPAKLQDGTTAVLTLKGPESDEHTQLSVADILSIEIISDRPRGFEFTTEHSEAILFVFRCNTHAKMIAGSPNLVFYCTTYSSKCPEGQLGQAAVMKDALDKARARQLASGGEANGRSTYTSLLNASTGYCVEIGVTTCAFLLLHNRHGQRGTLFQYSHQFENVLTSQVMDYVNGETFRAATMQVEGTEANLAAADHADAEADRIISLRQPNPTSDTVVGSDDEFGAEADDSQGAPSSKKTFQAVPAALTYQCRSAALREINFVEFASWYKLTTGALGGDAHKSKYTLSCEHPRHDTHHLQRRRHIVVPNLIGSRIPNRSCFYDANPELLERYCCYALVMYKAWGGGCLRPALTIQRATTGSRAIAQHGKTSTTPMSGKSNARATS